MKTKDIIIGDIIYTVEYARDIEEGEPFIYTGRGFPELIIAQNGINVHSNDSHFAVIGMHRKDAIDMPHHLPGLLSEKQFLLIKLSEECAEVSQRAVKALLFGMDEKQPNQELDNRQRLIGEINDLLGILELMREHQMLPVHYRDEELIRLKKEKVRHYYGYSQKLGIVE